jgi:hypothetical protein
LDSIRVKRCALSVADGAKARGVFALFEFALKVSILAGPDAGQHEGAACGDDYLGQTGGGAAAGLLLGDPALEVVGIAQVVAGVFIGRVDVEEIDTGWHKKSSKMVNAQW